MARGKYADKAAKRQAELAVTNDLASYQHRVARLTAENRELRERLAAQERAAKQTERRLRAERDEGVAPQVAALQLANNQLREKLAKSQRSDRDMGTVYQRMARRFCVHLVAEHGMDLEAARSFVHTTAGQKRAIDLPAADIAAIDGEKIKRGNGGTTSQHRPSRLG